MALQDVQPPLDESATSIESFRLPSLVSRNARYLFLLLKSSFSFFFFSVSFSFSKAILVLRFSVSFGFAEALPPSLPLGGAGEGPEPEGATHKLRIRRNTSFSKSGKAGSVLG